MRTVGLLLAMALAATAARAAAPISPERMSSDVKILASDAFEGRAPGTVGEQRTVEWLIAKLKDLGLQPGGAGGGWTQAVPLVRTQVTGGTMQAGGMSLAQSREIYVSTVRPVDRIKIEAAPMVFVGYGVAAPERKWDDFKGVDLKGKVAVFLVNDPDFEAAPSEAVAGVFGGRRMTFYGRWVYKFEEAARRGAVAALIVHDTPGAGYGWSTVTAPGGENYDIVRRNPNERVLLQGWIQGEAARSLFERAGLDLSALRVLSRRADFKPVTLTGTSFSADLSVKQDRVESANVLGKLPGTTRPDEVVMLGAHWDAYGKGVPDAAGAIIRPGANDDAMGMAGLFEIARALKARPAARTSVFAFWTAEERGLLGSEFYAVNPIYPVSKTVANITLDILQTGGPAHDVMLVGNGQNSLEQDLAKAAAAQGRVVTPETLPERGLYYRADHFSLARRGVPSLLFMAISGAPDLVDGGRTAGARWLKSYMACYHQTCDRWDPNADMRGAAQDVELALSVARGLADSDRWPEWNPGSEFDAVRKASRH